MGKVFLSYSRQSETVVKSLVDDLEALGHTTWFDQELSGGQVWWEKILSNILDCDIFIFALSPESLDSTACKREHEYAAALGKPILPVQVAEGVSTNLLPSALATLQIVDFQVQDDRNAPIRLARAVTDVPPPGPLPEPLPAAPEVPVSYLGGLAEQVAKTSSMAYEEQATLVAQLKTSLREPDTAHDARSLLERLRKRRDLLASSAADIDELLGDPSVTTTPIADDRSRQGVAAEPPDPLRYGDTSEGSGLVELRSQLQASISQIVETYGLSERPCASEERSDADALVLGPERIYNPMTQRRVGGDIRPRCFVAISFGAPWSAAVFGMIRSMCELSNVRPVRGDDLFSPMDDVDDLFERIITSDLVIADVTDRNTNVFYGLGIAQTMGKPVLILSQSEDDVPYVYKTRRWLLYDTECLG